MSLVPIYQSCRDINYEGIRNKENQFGKLRLLSFGDTDEVYKTTWLGTHGLYQSQTLWTDTTTREGLTMKNPRPCFGCGQLIFLTLGINGHWIKTQYEGGPRHICMANKGKSILDVAKENAGILLR